MRIGTKTVDSRVRVEVIIDYQCKRYMFSPLGDEVLPARNSTRLW
jgi:hypothetical protein